MLGHCRGVRMRVFCAITGCAYNLRCALAGRALRRLASRAGHGHAIEQLLFGADLRGHFSSPVDSLSLTGGHGVG
jgi:hypothetical protein